MRAQHPPNTPALSPWSDTAILHCMSAKRRQSEVAGEVPGGKPEVSGDSKEAPGGRWLTVAEVAELIGMSERSARDWIKRHGLPPNDARPLRVEERAVREQLAHEHRTLRRPPEVPGEVSGGKPEAFGGATEPIEAAYRVAGEAVAEVALVPLATMVEELRGLADQLAELARRNESLALEVGTLRERQAGHEGQLVAKETAVAAKDETIAELRHRAEAAEAELARRHEEEARAAELLRRRNEQEWLNRERMQAAQDAPGVPEGTSTDDPSGVSSAGFWARVRRGFGGGRA